ncbi:nitrilase-related carbon-nitrogen hydrolase [Bosea sp. (in: a-proteobacteria)]|uniref:nitrilase-related carbon-nitrogen hydrolase n=1 Tax=Bosea sp. (in: a-proteobacteria) TaxID=1871050 RepID=UPI0027340BAE|nr:nitrilase-related carbon-nitrogen hydrolase [Bosea sp. (in: a-proteobacteria)]MDP3258785.1 nitrilase-related carbon-nitrogen hydrolase [Bosea sp. (in: a-proteobacteria)]
MTEHSFRLALGQISPLLGDVAGNADLVRAARHEAARAGADLVLFPELMLAGGQAAGLTLLPAFQDACRRSCEALARETADGGPALLLGLPWVEGGRIYNALALLDGGVIQAVRFKVRLGAGGAYDEAGVFSPGPLPGPVPFRGRVRLGLAIGADIADEEVAECLAETGAEMLLVAASSAYHRGSGDVRMNEAVARVVETGLPLVWLNAVGRHDEDVLDGASFALDHERNLTLHLPAFAEAHAVMPWRRERGAWRSEPGEIATVPTADAADYAACVLGLRDHVRRVGSAGILLALDGPDAALDAMMAVDAVGPERVRAVVLTSGAEDRALADSQAFARTLGIPCRVVPVAPLGAILAETLGQGIEPTSAALAAARGALLAALAAQENLTLLTKATAAAAPTVDVFDPVKPFSASEIARLCELRQRWKPAGALGPEDAIVPAAWLAQRPDPQRDEILSALGQGRRVAEFVADGHAREMVLALQEELGRRRALARFAAPGVNLTAEGPRQPPRHGFVDSGEPVHEPDAALVRGVGLSGGESVDF